MKFKELYEQEETGNNGTNGSNGMQNGDNGSDVPTTIRPLIGRRAGRVAHPKSGMTSKENGHKHDYRVDVKGDGTASTASGHTHSIKGWIIQPTAGHSHFLTVK